MLGRASVVLIGSEVATALFGHADGVTGETIRIEGQPFRVIGVLETKGGGAFGSEDNQVIVPFTTCLLYTSDAADERSSVDLGGRRIIKKKKNT